MPKLLTISPEPQQSYNLHVQLGHHSMNFRYEVLLSTIALITVWYAVRAFRATRRNNELSTVPHLTIVRTGSIGSYQLLLRNHNKRLAYRIRIDPVRTLSNETNQLGKTTFEVQPARIHSRRAEQVEFPGGDEQVAELPLKILSDGEEIDQDFAIFKATMLTKYAHGLVFRFKDSQNLSYFTRLDFKFESGNSIVLRAPTRLSLSWRLLLWLERNALENVLLGYQRLRIATRHLLKKLLTES